MPCIRIIEPEPGSSYELPTAEHAEIVVGSAPYCHLSMPEIEGLAGMHACIVRGAQGYKITDLKSPGGTLEDGVPIQGSVHMKPGVQYRMGSLCLVLEEEAAAAQAAVQAELLPAVPQMRQPEVVPVYVQVPQPVRVPQSIPVQVQEVRIVQQVAPAKRALPPTSKQRKREISVLMARLHRKKRYNYILWIFLWFFFTALMVTALVAFILPESSKKDVERYLHEKMRVYEAEGIPGLLQI